MNQQKLISCIRDIPDFPKPGIIFKDITPIFADPELCAQIVEEFRRRFNRVSIDAVAGVEARGFLFGFLLAQAWKVPFVPIRKAGKLPYQKISREYALEYGTAKIEMHIDAVLPGQHILLHDDLLATGGSAEAAAELIEEAGGKVSGFAFLVNLAFLGGEKKLRRFTQQIESLVVYFE